MKLKKARVYILGAFAFVAPIAVAAEQPPLVGGTGGFGEYCTLGTDLGHKAGIQKVHGRFSRLIGVNHCYRCYQRSLKNKILLQ